MAKWPRPNQSPEGPDRLQSHLLLVEGGVGPRRGATGHGPAPTAGQQSPGLLPARAQLDPPLGSTPPAHRPHSLDLWFLMKNSLSRSLKVFSLT